MYFYNTAIGYRVCALDIRALPRTAELPHTKLFLNSNHFAHVRCAAPEKTPVATAWSRTHGQVCCLSRPRHDVTGLRHLRQPLGDAVASWEKPPPIPSACGRKRTHGDGEHSVCSDRELTTLAMSSPRSLSLFQLDLICFHREIKRRGRVLISVTLATFPLARQRQQEERTKLLHTGSSAIFFFS